MQMLSVSRRTGLPRFKARSETMDAGRSGSRAGLPRYLQRTADASQMKTIQRDGPTLSSYGSNDLMHPRPNFGVMPSPQYQLQLDPQIEAMIRANAMMQAMSQLTPENVRAAIAALDIHALVTGSAPLIPPSGTTVPPSGADTPPVTPGTASPKPGTDPPPVVFTPTTPHEAEAGDMLTALQLRPEVVTLTGTLKSNFMRDFNSLSPGGKALSISAVTTIGLGALAGVTANADSRKAFYGFLSGKSIPTFVVPGLSFEFNTVGSNLLFGLHYDVGPLLGKLGFGEAANGDPAFTGPWTPPPPSVLMPPAQRDPEPGAHALPNPNLPRSGGEMRGGTMSIAERIEAAGEGKPLPFGMQRRLEAVVGSDLSGVRVHTDSHAHSLAQSLQARAFTSGNTLFFQAGTYRPDTAEGQRLLAHEALHTVQQARGSVEGEPTSYGVRISDPIDHFERDARAIEQKI